MREPFARIPQRYDNAAADRRLIEAVIRTPRDRRRQTRCANLGTFTGYRIGLDLGNGNIGWCVLFENGPTAHFLTAEDIAEHNAALPRSTRRTQFPDLAGFVPIGVHKFQPREPGEKVERSHSKVRAEARAKRGLLDARQWRRFYMRKALVDAGLLPQPGEDFCGHLTVKSDRLRVALLDPLFPAHPHDLGRALYNTLLRRGWMKPIGRAGADERSSFGRRITENYREALRRFGCETIGQFLERCAQDARRDGAATRKRHRPLSWQRDHSKEKPKDGEDAKTYDLLRFLTPTFELIWEEAELLRERQKINASVSDEAWAEIKKKAEFRRGLEAKTPGPCRWLPGELRCVRALPSFQRFRILEAISHLRHAEGRRLGDAEFGTAKHLLEVREKVTLGELARELGATRLRFDKNDEVGVRTLAGARTDIALTRVLGESWRRLPIEQRDDWTMRFLRRHWPRAQKIPSWSPADEEKLERDAEAAFGSAALERIDEEGRKGFEDKFASISLKAAQILARAYELRLGHAERMEELHAAGAPKPELPLYERLPYYGAVMPDLTVPATGFAPKERICAEELAHGRAPNPDLHVVLNRLRAVVNDIIEMMGGILPTRCVVEVARSALSEDAANEHAKRSRERERLRETILNEIDKVYEGLGRSRPIGPGLDRLIDRWKAAVRQNWRDYDGNVIARSHLIDGAEYQLDHVVPRAFGEYRENNMFVSRFNREKGRRLPWALTEAHPDFAASLAAYAAFGFEQRIKILEGVLHPRPPRKEPSGEKKKEIEEALNRAREQHRTVEALDPRSDVLNALRRTLTDRLETLASGEMDDDPAARGVGRPFDGGDQSRLFCSFHPNRQPPEGGFAARDIAEIGWSTRAALRYLQHLGAETVAIKPWATHAMRCMFSLNKERADLRNHAVDAFIVAHFDDRVLRPAFDRLSANRFEELYETRALSAALARVAHGRDFLNAFERNLAALDRVLGTIGTAHRPDNRWNPGDGPGGSFGALGGENIYTFRPTFSDRRDLTRIVAKAGKTPIDSKVMRRNELLELLLESEPLDERSRKMHGHLKRSARLQYRSRQQNKTKTTWLNAEVAEALREQFGAFIDAESKFAVIGPSDKGDRMVVSVAKLSRMTPEERNGLFRGGRTIYRRGDLIRDGGSAYVVTGLLGDGRLIAYPIDVAVREPETKRRIPVPINHRRKEPLPLRLQNDVLGRRLHRLRKSDRGLDPVPYPLRER